MSDAERLGRLETRLDTEIKHLATKEDLQSIRTFIEEKMSGMLRWLIGVVASAGIAIVASLITLIISLLT